jgi:signal transduction histidine kinase
MLLGSAGCESAEMIATALGVAIGSLEILLVATVLRRFWRFRRGFPWLIALALFFLLRGVDRIVVSFAGEPPPEFGLALDVVLLVVLVLLLLTIERVIAGLQFAEDAARYREREYDRALRDYRRLVRHRLANPLTAIVGSARALRELPADAPALREELLDVLEQEAERLQKISLDPTGALGAEEQALRPEPELELGLEGTD